MAAVFFADHCVPTMAVARLREAGFEVHELRDHLPINSPDEEVIAEAQRRDAVLISLDGDFADIVRYPPSLYGGIVALQVKNRPRALPQILNRLLDYLSAHPEASELAGKLILVEPSRIRVR